MLRPLLALALSTAALAATPELSVIRIPAASRAALDALQKEISLDFIDVQPDHVLASVNVHERALLDGRGVRYTVEHADAEAYINQGRAAGVGAYHTYEMVQAELAAHAAAAPELARVTTIGTSVEGRAIPALVLEAPGAVPQAERPKMLIMGLHHAREWISVEVPMALADKLVKGWTSNDPAIRALLSTRTLWIVPIVNPDGHKYSQSGSTMWRKNRHKTWYFSTNGVDPNRNYGFEWVGAGSSNMPFSETYRGESAFSEPETQAIRALAEREKFTAGISYHSFSELVLFPWGHTRKICPDDKTFRGFATEMGRITKYRPQTGADLYIVNGECDDYLYGTLGTWAWTVELGKQFIPKDKDIPLITGPNVEAALHVIRNLETLAGDPGIMLHLVERLTGLAGTPKGPWSPGAGDEGLRRRTLDWAARELGHRLSALAQTRGRAAIAPYLEKLSNHAAGDLPELEAAARAAAAAVPR